MDRADAETLTPPAREQVFITTTMPGTSASDRSSHHDSPSSAASAPSWAPPRAPLPPHRLAKLANALGVPTPLTTAHFYSSSLTVSSPPLSSSSPSLSDHFRRSPTPSAASAQTYTTTASSSKYLLHVLPPEHLPHESQHYDDPELLPPPPGASGYHTQFRRGVLVPVYPTLSSQLAAIAKEYALPSTVGLILYLVITTAVNTSGPELDEPGPRISDDIWRHIWLRVVRSERDDSLPAAPRPMGLGLGTPSPAQSSFLHDATSPALRPLISPGRIEIPQPQLPMTPSPSTASQSVFSSQSEFEPPESMSSVSAGPTDPDDLPLPGLISPALVPVLAKVEFDIDRRRAAWYEPWLRSRRVNHAKRAESRLGMRKRAESKDEDGEVEGEEGPKRAPMDLRLVGRLRNDSSVPRFLQTAEEFVDEFDVGYAQLPEDDEEVHDDDATARLGAPVGDPLADVFGTDAETWADLHAEVESGERKRQTNPNVVDLALDGAALSAISNAPEDQAANDTDEEEVKALWNHHSRPSLVVSIPSPPSTKRRSSPTTAGTVTSKRPPPPPLNLVPSLPSSEGLAVQGSPSAPSSLGSARLPYWEDATPSTSSEHGGGAVQDEAGHDRRMSRSPLEEKREGAFFEDLDLGLSIDDDTVEYDESDPHDRRRSQLLMKAQLDEIERNLIQLSPRRLNTESIDEGSPRRTPYSTTLSPPPQWGGSPLKPAASPRESAPPLPEEGASWPAVPYSSFTGANGHHPSESHSRAGSSSKSRPPSPPRIAFNGVSTEPPKGALGNRSRSGTISNETLARQRELQEELYPPLTPPMLNNRHGGDSPIIPLSPDPFGRFPSEAEANRLTEERHEDERLLLTVTRRPPASRKGSMGPYDQFDPEDRVATHTPSSRFSLDSITSDDAGKSSKAPSLVSMKSIKKLWRKTNSKLSISGAGNSGLESGRSSPNYPNGLEQPSGRRSSRSVSKSPQPEYALSEAPQPKARRKASIPSMQFMQDPRSSLVPARTPPLDSRQPSPALPPLPSTTPSPSTSPQFAHVPISEKNGSVRKSILKSWKSASGSLSVNTATPSSSSTPRSSTELLGDAQVKRRRPSVLDGSAPSKRGSTVSAATTLVDLPPSPAIPDEFAFAQSRKRSSQSNLLSNGARRASGRPRPSPSMSSSSTLSSSSPPRPSRLTPTGSPPKNGRLSRASDMSDERPSFDVSQFEIVSPKMGASPLETTLSYPYHTLDHSMTSAE